MNESSLVKFIERLKTDDDLRQKVADAETKLSATIQRETASIAEIAASAGYDITGWSGRPSTAEPTPSELDISFCCSLTCCVVSTSLPPTPSPPIA